MSGETPTTTGRSRALLLGCPLGSLKGVETDLRSMENVLGEYGFTSKWCYRATREQILNAWNTFIDQTLPEDAVVIYYSGHGGKTKKKKGESDTASRMHLQYLIPFDFGETKEGDWRGITDMELSEILHKTTSKTKNVTVILDCCHSSRMARRPGTVKAIDPDDYREVLKHIEKMMKEGKFDNHFHHERNPLAISIAAAAQTEEAMEDSFDDGTGKGYVWKGALTEALEKALRQARQGIPSTQVSWRSIMLRIRDRMKVTAPGQYPQIEGDDLRFTFSLEGADPHGAIPVSRSSDGVVLQGGRIHGVDESDIYAVLPLNEERLHPDKQIAEIVVTRVGPIASWARFEGGLRPTLEDGAKAFLKKKALRGLPIALLVSADISEKLRLSLESSRFLCIADGDDQPLLATVTLEASQLVLHSHEGNIKFVLGEWELRQDGNHDAEIADCIARLESLARSRHLLTLPEQTAPGPISEQVDVEIGLVEDQQCQPFSEETVVVEEGERFYVKIRNTSSSKRYVSIFDVCADSVTLLSTGSPSGHELREGQSYTYGAVDFTGQLVGSQVSWPRSVPKREEIPETVVVIVTDGRLDLRGLETGARSARRTGNDSALSELIDDVASGVLRTLPTENQQARFLQYGVRRFYFRLKSSSPHT